jgi:hypothetical protein
LWLSMEDDQGRAWWTDSYRLIRQGGNRGWRQAEMVPAVRDSDGLLIFAEWMAPAEVGAIARAGGPTQVVARADEVRKVRDLLDEGGKAWRKLDQLATACEATAPDFGKLIRDAEGRVESQVRPVRLIASDAFDTAVLESAEGMSVHVNADYLAAFRGDVTLWAVHPDKMVRVDWEGETVGLLMPVRGEVTPLAACDMDKLMMAAAHDLAGARLWQGKKMVEAASAKVFELLRRLDVLAVRP